MRAILTELVSSMMIALVFAITFQTAAFANFSIPSESMVPTLRVGDRLAASKFSYGWSRHSLPFGLSLPQALDGRVFGKTPARGDIAIFTHPLTGVRMIKRVIGLPGDRIAFEHGKLVLNGRDVPRSFQRTFHYREYQGEVVEVAELVEHLPNGAQHKIIERTNIRDRRNVPERVIPSDHLFMMGDNRDNSADSRYREMGFVPEANLIARAELVVFSFYDCLTEPGVDCAGPRYGLSLR
jgi:signal peptidase I